MIDDLRDHLIDEFGFKPTDPIFKKMMADIQLIVDGYLKERELKARLEELEAALYVYENQVPYHHALAGALGGAEKDLSEGIFVEIDGSKKVVTGGINFKLPHFFNDRITELSQTLKQLEEEL